MKRTREMGFGILIRCRVVEQPLKIPFVAGAVLYANAEKSEVAQEILDRAGPMCQEALDAGDWRSFKLLLRFLACLEPLYKEDGIVPILDELFNRAVDLQTASSEDVSTSELLLSNPILTTVAGRGH